jgi:hypothetical protein
VPSQTKHILERADRVGLGRRLSLQFPMPTQEEKLLAGRIGVAELVRDCRQNMPLKFQQPTARKRVK